MCGLILCLMFVAAVVTGADDSGFERAVLILSGASCMEDLDESTVEMYTLRRISPIDLNASSPARLRSSGLLTPYQCASIADYRSRCGDIISFAELALVDGIGEEVAQALKMFVTLRTHSAVGEKPSHGSRHSLMVRAGTRLDCKPLEAALCGGLKYSGEVSDFMEFKYSNRTTYANGEILPGTFGVAYYGRRWLENAIVGDYNLRIGQGLCQWSGTTMSGVSTVSALKKNGTGASLSGSFGGGHRGVAASLRLGSGWGLLTALSLPGLRENMDGSSAQIGVSPVVHASYVCSSASIGATGFFERLPGSLACGASVDWNAGIPSLNFYGEAAWCGQAAGKIFYGNFALVTGLAWIPQYGHKYGIVFRYYPSDFYCKDAGALRSGSKVADEHAVSAAATLKWFISTLDFVYHPSDGDYQYKGLLQFSPEISLGQFRIIPSLRYATRLRLETPLSVSSVASLRHDLRCETSVSWREFSVAGRYNAVWLDNYAWLWYIEAAYKNDFSLYARWTLFKVDDWDDRIYCYERDNPGNYTVPAFYGRGWEFYTIASYRLHPDIDLRRRHDFGLRVSYKTYPWNLVPKRPVLEVKIQYSVIF